MRIVIDMQGAQTESRFRGIGRYTLSLVKAIIKNRQEHNVFIVLSSLLPETIQPIRNEFKDILCNDSIIVWSAPGPTLEADPSNNLRRNCAEVLYEGFLASLKPDVLLITSLFEGLGDNAVTSIGKLAFQVPTACILYDLIPLISPDEFFRDSGIHQKYYKNKLSSLKNSTCLLAISESSRREAICALGLDPNRVINIGGASDHLIFNSSTDIQSIKSALMDMNISYPYIMYTGGADDRKNLHRLIKAYSTLSPEILSEYQLVFVGKMPCTFVETFKNTAKSCGLRKENIVFTGYVSDETLAIIYQNAHVFVFPSLHEGFGLPPLEAMNYGIPVIASNTTSLPEVMGNPDALFDPYSIESISGLLKKSILDEEFRQSLVAHGLRQVKLFTWDKTALTALSAMETISNQWYLKGKYKKRLSETIRSTVIKGLCVAGLDSSADDKYIRALARSIASNEPRIGLTQIFLDVSTLIHEDARSGIQRVVRSLLKELLTNPPDGYVVRPIYLDGIIYRYASSSKSELEVQTNIHAQPPVSFWSGDIYLALDLNMHLTSVMHGIHEEMRNRGVSLNFIVYDLLLATNPRWWISPNPQLFLDWLNSICSISDNLVCISESVRNELAQWIKANKKTQISGLPNLKYFHLGSDIVNSHPSCGMPNDAVDLLAQLQDGTIFLMVGTIEPRKGHKQVLDAFGLLWLEDPESKYKLVIVGKAGWLVEELLSEIRGHQELGKRLIWLEGISDEYLENVYARSHSLIAASYGEGFGLPLIEAAQHGLSILARDIPVFKEVAGVGAFYFHGRDASSLKEEIKAWLKLYNESNHPKSTDISFLSWNESAIQLKKALNLIE
jgi:glycosyltransferase involved in cell wall biosynthesis